MTSFLRMVLVLVACVSMSSYALAADEEKDNAGKEEKKVEALKCDKTIVIEGEIGSELTAEMFKTLIPCLERGEEQLLVINSPGGDPWTAFGIFEALRLADSGHRLTIRTQGRSASAAVLISLASEAREIGCYSHFYLHEVSTTIVANAKAAEIYTMGARSETVTEIYVKIVAMRTGLSTERVEEMMEEEKTLLAEEAKELGFATDIVGCE